MEYAYHPMTIDDYDEIYALWQSVPGVGLSDADSYDNINMYLSQNPNQSYVCRFAGQIVGTILCGSDGRRAYIHHTAVSPQHRRKGIATELVRLAMIAQKERGVRKTHLFIFEGNEQGKAFWRAAGFAEREDIGIMSKNLI